MLQLEGGEEGAQAEARAKCNIFGPISKEKAANQAEAEYEQFAAKRRAYIESEAEREIIEDLEDTAKQLPPPPESDEAP